MLYPNLMIQLLARMMSTTKCLNTSLMMLCSLYILNNIWALGKFPTSRCTSTVIPVPKPGKDTSDPSNYCPTALTSCICKVMERMINSRLVLYLERNKLISPMQCGFRKQRKQCLGAYRTSPASSLCVEANLMTPISGEKNFHSSIA